MLDSAVAPLGPCDARRKALARVRSSPIGRRAQRRALVASVVLHAAVLLPAVLVVVRSHEVTRTPHAVRLNCSEAKEAEPLAVVPPLEVAPPEPRRVEPEVRLAPSQFPAFEPDTPEPALVVPPERSAFGGPGLGQRLPPNGTSMEPGTGSAGEGEEAQAQAPDEPGGGPCAGEGEVVTIATTGPILVRGTTDTAGHYPEQAERRGWEGVVVLRLVVGRDGTVVRVDVQRADRPVFLREVRAMVAEWRFRPATENGVAVESGYGPVRFVFTRRDP